MPAIARLTIRLDDVEPEVVRRVEVPADIGLVDLHLVIQAAMGWENYHLYAFHAGRNLSWGIPDPDWPEDTTLPARKATLADVIAHLKKNKTFQYVYDFGDDWGHTIKLEAIAEAEPDVAYPRLTEARGACPPEDCGGPWGYAHLLEVLADPNHEEHDEMVEWCGPGFDPAAVNEAAIRKALAKLANHRRRKTKAAP